MSFFSNQPETELEKELISSIAYVQFEMGCQYWEAREFQNAERWLRYASLQGHELARNCLKREIENGIFIHIKEHLHEAASKLLQQFVTPLPEERHIEVLKNFLINYFEEHYGLIKLG